MTEKENTWTLSLSDPWFTYMKNGKKLYEGRVYRGLPKYIEIGDIITFYLEGEKKDKFSVVVTNKYMFGTFEESLQKLSLNDILPDISSIENGTEIYKKFATINTQQKYGVVQIKIKLISSNI